MNEVNTVAVIFGLAGTVFMFGAGMNATYATIILLAILVCATIGMVVNSIRTLKHF